MSINKIILIGRLGKDPEMRYSNQQTAICSFSLATSERRKDASGTWGEHTEWHNIIVFGKTAENCSTYLKKGRQVFIEGRLQTRKWQDRKGGTVIQRKLSPVRFNSWDQKQKPTALNILVYRSQIL